MIADKSKVLVSIPHSNPDKIIGRVRGSFTTNTSFSPGFGATYDGIHTIPNPIAKLALPLTRYTINGTDYFGDFEQDTPIIVVGAVTASEIKYRWASNTGATTVQYETVLISID